MSTKFSRQVEEYLAMQNIRKLPEGTTATVRFYPSRLGERTKKIVVDSVRRGYCCYNYNEGSVAYALLADHFGIPSLQYRLHKPPTSGYSAVRTHVRWGGMPENALSALEDMLKADRVSLRLRRAASTQGDQRSVFHGYIPTVNMLGDYAALTDGLTQAQMDPIIALVLASPNYERNAEQLISSLNDEAFNVTALFQNF